MPSQLVLGPVGSGKTVLVKRLSACFSSGSYTDLPEMPVTINTVGINLTTLPFKKQEVTLREVGGCMAPIWHNYFQEALAVIFVIDASNRHQVAAASIELYTLLKSQALAAAPFLILLNKVDCANAMSRQEADFLFRLPALSRALPVGRLSVAEVSAKDGRGLRHVIDWICDAPTAPKIVT